VTTPLLHADFIDFIQCLNDADVEYMLVGGYATIIHGYNRTTGDLDIWVNQKESNYQKLAEALKEFKMPVFDMSKEKFLHDTSVDVFTFGRPPVSIDIITQLKGLQFDRAWKNVQEKEIDENIKVKVIHVDDLIRAKRASNRPKDQDDIDHIS